MPKRRALPKPPPDFITICQGRCCTRKQRPSLVAIYGVGLCPSLWTRLNEQFDRDGSDSLAFTLVEHNMLAAKAAKELQAHFDIAHA